MVDENDGSPSGANFIAFTNSLTFYGNNDRTSHGDALSFTSNTDKLKYDGTEFGRLVHISGGGDFGIGTTNPGAKLDVRGTCEVSGNLTGGGQLYLTSGWFRTYGSQGWYNETHQGGWHMTDSTWMRTYNQKSIWAGDGKICCNGNMGAGTSSPSEKLEVVGNIKASGRVYTSGLSINTTQTAQRLEVNGGASINGDIDGYGMTSGDTLWTKDGKVFADTPRYSVVDYRYEKITQGMGRSVTSSRFTGMVVWTPVNNDDAAAVFLIAENSNSGNGSVTRIRHQADYYNSGRDLSYFWSNGKIYFKKNNMSSGHEDWYRVTIYGVN